MPSSAPSRRRSLPSHNKNKAAFLPPCLILIRNPNCREPAHGVISPSPSLPFRDLFQLRPKTVVRHGLDKLSGYIDFEAFRERLGAEGACGLFDTFWKVMEEAGIKFSKGVAIEASFQEAPRERNSREENKRIKEEGAAPAEWNAHKRAQKGKETHYGYKNHVAADVKTKLIKDYRVTPASDLDISVFEEFIPEHTRDIYADSAYMSAWREAALKAAKKRPHIVKRKTRCSAQLTGCQKHINHVIAKKRCRVEHVFGQIKQFGGDTVRPIGMARCAVRVALVNIVFNMLRFACLKFQEQQAFTV